MMSAVTTGADGVERDRGAAIEEWWELSKSTRPCLTGLSVMAVDLAAGLVTTRQ